MNQYTELFHQYHSQIKNPSAGILNAVRDEAMKRFEAMGFPPSGSEEYQHTDVGAWFAPDYGLNINRLPISVNPYDAFRCDVPNLSTQLYFLVNDAFYSDQLSKGQLPEGVLIGSLNAFAQSHPEIVGKYYNQAVAQKEIPTTDFNTAFCQDGFFLYVPKNVVIEKPIQLVSLLRGNIDMLVNRRMLIIIEENAEAKLLVCDHSMDENNFLANQVTEVYVAKNGRFDMYELEETNTSTRRISSTYVQQKEDSNVVINGTSLFNGQTRNNYFVLLAGERAEASLTGMAIMDNEQRVDTQVVVDHAVPYCTSNQLFKYVLDEQSQGAFCGRVLVRQDAQKTMAYQSNKNLCISKDAKMHTKPQLEIYADDVKCSHGATVGQLDENALFYMRSRGLSEQESRMLLKFAFTADVIDTIRLDALKDRLHLLVEKRFRGELAKCAGCRACQ